MIDGLRPYSETKPTALPWLGDVPTQWDVRRNGRLFGPRRETDFPDLPVLEVSIRSGVRIRDFGNGGRKQGMADRSKYQRAVRGDIAYNMMRMWQGAVGIAPADGLVSPAYVVARPFPETNAAYYAYLFRTSAYMREIDVFSRGIVPDRNRLYWESFKQMPSVCPPLDEQRLIVRFLDWHGTQTAKLIRAKKKLIALLNEQKQATIHRAVTRGLDPNVKLKPSGVPWLGDVPEGWAIFKIRHCGRILGGMTPSMDNRSFWDGNIPWVSPKDMKRREITGSLMYVTKAALENTSLRLIDAGAVLMVVRGMILARHIPVARTTVPVTINQDMKAIIPEKSVHPDFLCHVLSSFQSALASLIDESGHGTRRFPTERWREMAFGFPLLTEQRAICDWIDRASHRENKAIEGAEREIALIQEFRTRLTADVVTGKLDVRALAATLPETFGPEAIDEPIDNEAPDEVTDDTENEEVAA
jgi:type I restriction enzyme, S subunit